jgi:transposase
MAIMHEECTTQVQHSDLRLFVSKKSQRGRCPQEILSVYGGKCLSRKTVHNWEEKFSQRRSKVADYVRPGRPVKIAAEATAQRVEELIQIDWSMMNCSVATALGCSHGLAYSITHDRLKFRKAFGQCVHREMKDIEKMSRMGVSLHHPLWYAVEGEDILNRIVTEDESWMRHNQSESKRAPLQWIHSSSPSTKMFEVTTLAGKVILAVFWDSQEVLFAHFQKRGENVNSVLYCEVLWMLQDAIRRIRLG